MTTFDLNADLGEGVGDDAAMLAVISSASIACGGHAGDTATMREAVRLAGARGVRVGAHPGFADRKNFGRVRLELSDTELAVQVAGQVAALASIAAQQGVTLAYVKLHGALANMAAEDIDVARVAFTAAQRAAPGLAVLAIDNSAQIEAAEAMGLAVIREAYGDRAYTPAGLLVARGEEGAIISDPEAIAARCVRLAETGEIVAADGCLIASRARSICLHGDTPGALAIARRVRDALEAAGIVVAAR